MGTHRIHLTGDSITMPSTLKPQWKCTQEPAANEQEVLPTRVGLTSPDYDPALEPEMTAQWRTKDADGNIGYQGIATPGTDFQPLDNLAQPDLGDVTIEYLQQDGEWRDL